MKNKYLKNYGAVLVLFSAFLTHGNAQITFEKIYPAIVHESGKDVMQTSDGGYIIAASTETSVTNDLDIMIVRTNNVGDLLWKKTYGTNLPSAPNSIVQTSDGNYFIVGYMVAPGSLDSDNYLIKVDGTTGDSLFSKVYGGYGMEDAKEIIATSDGNYVIVGASNSISISDNQMQLIKIDPNGNVIWTQYFGGSGYESARSVKQTPDGGFIIAGKTVTSGIASVQLVKTTPTGGHVWTQTFSGGANSWEGKSVVANSDGSYTLSVDDSSLAMDSDVRVMKVNAAGTTVVWNKLYGGTEKDISKMIKPTSDGGYMVTALSRSFGWVNPDYWLLKLNASGDTTWTRHFGSLDHEHCYAVKQTSDLGYVAVGHTRGNNPGRIEEIMLLKLNTNGEFGPVEINEYVAAATLSVYPNPSEGVVSLDVSGLGSSKGVCRVLNGLGQEVYSGMIDPAAEDQTIDLSKNTPGVYFVILACDSGQVTKRIVLN